MRILKLHCFLLLIVSAVLPGQSQEHPTLASLLAEAQQAQARGDYATAAHDYSQAIKLQPAEPKLWANLGLMQHEAGKYMQAIASFQHAEILDPNLYVPNLFLGLDYQKLNKPKKAVQFLATAEKMNPQDVQPPLALGHAYAALGSNVAAIQQFERVLSMSPNTSSAWFAIGIAYLDLVEPAARTMSTEYRKSAYAADLLADTLTQQSRFQEAIQLYKKITVSSDLPPCVQSQLGFAYFKMKDIPNAKLAFDADLKQHPECSLALLGKVGMAVQAGDNEQALQILEQLWSRDVGFVQANRPALLAGIEAGQWEAFNRYAIGVGDVNESLLNVLAGQTSPVTSSKLKQDSDVIAAKQSYSSGNYGRCVQQTSKRPLLKSVEARRLLTTCSYLTGDYALASKSSREMLSVNPHSVEGLFWTIQSNEKLAYQALDKFQQLEPNSARSHILLGDIYRQKRRFKDAIAEYNEALVMAPDDEAALLGLVYAYYGNSEFVHTESMARKALKQNPQDTQLNLLMGESLINTHNYAEAEPFVKKSLQAKPQLVPHVHALLGIVYAETNRTQEAIAELKLGLSSDEDGSYHYRIARLYSQIGDKKDSDIAMMQMKQLQQQSRNRAASELQESNYFQNSDESSN